MTGASASDRERERGAPDARALSVSREPGEGLRVALRRDLVHGVGGDALGTLYEMTSLSQVGLNLEIVGNDGLFTLDDPSGLTLVAGDLTIDSNTSLCESDVLAFLSSVAPTIGVSVTLSNNLSCP